MPALPLPLRLRGSTLDAETPTRAPQPRRFNVPISAFAHSLAQLASGWDRLITLAQPATAWHSLAQPGTAWHSLAQLGLAWHSLGEIQGDGEGLLSRGVQVVY